MAACRVREGVQLDDREPDPHPDTDTNSHHHRAAGTFQLFPSTNGPSSAISYRGSWTSSVHFMVMANAMWFEGYWWWVCPTGGLTAPQTFYLRGWLGIGGDSATITVPGSTVTSGTLYAGWNDIPLPSRSRWPLARLITARMAGSTLYSANTDVNGNFPTRRLLEFRPAGRRGDHQRPADCVL